MDSIYLEFTVTAELYLGDCVIYINVILSANIVPQKTHYGLLDTFMLGNFDVEHILFAKCVANFLIRARVSYRCDVSISSKVESCSFWH